MPQIRWSARAPADLLDIWLGIAPHALDAADRVYDRIEARLRILETSVQAGPARPDIAPEARALVQGPYLILYRIVADGAQIVRVLHGARNIGRALFLEGIEPGDPSIG